MNLIIFISRLKKSHLPLHHHPVLIGYEQQHPHVHPGAKEISTSSKKERTNRVKSFYRVLSGSLEQFPQPFLDRIGYIFKHHFTRHLPETDLHTVADERVVADICPVNVLHVRILKEYHALETPREQG